MSFRLIDKGWGRELRGALKADGTALRIICPFIKCSVVEELLAIAQPQLLQVITRFDCCAFYESAISPPFGDCLTPAPACAA
jgi:hypothetical protein